MQLALRDRVVLGIERARSEYLEECMWFSLCNPSMDRDIASEHHH